MSDLRPYTREEWSRDPSEGRWNPTRVRLTVEGLFAEVASLRAALEECVNELDLVLDAPLDTEEEAMMSRARAALAGRGPEARGEAEAWLKQGEPVAGVLAWDRSPDDKPSPDVRAALEELVDIVQGHLDDGDKLDSFTLQPARDALAAKRKEWP